MNDTIKNIAEGLFVLPGESLEKGYLLGSRCQECSLVTFPKRSICPNCLVENTMEEIPLSKKGKLYTFSVNEMAPQGFEAPYITGRVDLPEQVRVFSIIGGCEAHEDSVQIGMDMELFFETIRLDENGNSLLGYKFRPIYQISKEQEG